MSDPNQPPLTVLVTEGRWDAVDAPTPCNLWLVQVLQAQGGINESVPQGTYHYNVTKVDGLLVASLYPAE